MRSNHDEARAPAEGRLELVLAGRHWPRFALLLSAMLAELTLAPFIEFLPHGTVLVPAITAAVLLAALAVAGQHRLAVVLCAVAVVMHLAASLSTGPALASAAHGVRLIFLCYVVALVFLRVLGEPAVTLDTVAGAACAYMLLGVAWGDLFMLLEGWRPGSFSVPASWTHGSGSSMRATLTYFSFATLTTVGYGEIHPTDSAAGSLCAAEALIGQLYLAIMIARLVGLHTSRARDGRHDTGEPA